MEDWRSGAVAVTVYIWQVWILFAFRPLVLNRAHLLPPPSPGLRLHSLVADAFPAVGAKRLPHPPEHHRNTSPQARLMRPDR